MTPFSGQDALNVEECGESKPNTGTHSLLHHFWFLVEDLIQPALFLASVDFSVNSVACKYEFKKKCPPLDAFC